jgi:hypothetical protein
MDTSEGRGLRSHNQGWRASAQTQADDDGKEADLSGRVFGVARDAIRFRP